MRNMGQNAILLHSKKRSEVRRFMADRRKRRAPTSRGRKRRVRENEPLDYALKTEIGLVVLFAVCIYLFISNFGIGGGLGNALSGVMFGLFGMTAYIVPVLLFVACAFLSSNFYSAASVRKVIAGGVLLVLTGMLFEMVSGRTRGMEAYDIAAIYQAAGTHKNGGGVIAGSLAFLSYHTISLAGTLILILVLAIIALVVLTEHSFIRGVKKGSRKAFDKTREGADSYFEHARERREERAARRAKEERLAAERREAEEDEKILRMDKKVSGVTADTALAEDDRQDMNEVPVHGAYEEHIFVPKSGEYEPQDDIHEIHIKRPDTVEEDAPYEPLSMMEEDHDASSNEIVRAKPVDDLHKVPVHTERNADNAPSPEVIDTTATEKADTRPKARVASENRARPKTKPLTEYRLPPLNLLRKGKAGAGADSDKTLRETAAKLRDTLHTFGVNVTVTDISQGPSVTRFELQPEMGTKVSKITSLQDDIKLNLAATEIRIEAPIPGKAAVGIEIPNREVSAVTLRELLESEAYKTAESKISFAVGKDIAGKTIVTDIAKMPHLLIAGATGSGKSVCINTLILSILYKARPDEVKLIMIDPKVVELSVYNGIPHLMIPVVTDPKKAAAALNWAVAEMENRYRLFADAEVRDLATYNDYVRAFDVTSLEEGEEAPEVLPQMVVIVDELADLMMVASSEVETAICRLAQLARAAGIHLIIATQRPSVDVITGLIKANMPSRIAFAVSSGIDSRTILDMNGAEKLLGKGDMLFYPQNYPKPQRVQGAFVSDHEIQDIVEFIKKQGVADERDEALEQKILSAVGNGGSSADGGGTNGDGRDEYFADAGRFIIQKEKASIGMLQRVFKIGFNRAARIMDQLNDAGVVSDEEGTKPRRVLMTMEEFEQLL